MSKEESAFITTEILKFFKIYFKIYFKIASVFFYSGSKMKGEIQEVGRLEQNICLDVRTENSLEQSSVLNSAILITSNSKR